MISTNRLLQLQEEEECEILLSSIRDDDFKDVEEENDLPLPPGIPPFTNQNHLNQNEHV